MKRLLLSLVICALMCGAVSAAELFDISDNWTGSSHNFYFWTEASHPAINIGATGGTWNFGPNDTANLTYFTNSILNHQPIYAFDYNVDPTISTYVRSYSYPSVAGFSITGYQLNISSFAGPPLGHTTLLKVFGNAVGSAVPEPSVFSLLLGLGLIRLRFRR